MFKYFLACYKSSTILSAKYVHTHECIGGHEQRIVETIAISKEKFGYMNGLWYNLM